MGELRHGGAVHPPHYESRGGRKSSAREQEHKAGCVGAAAQETAVLLGPSQAAVRIDPVPRRELRLIEDFEQVEANA